MIFRPSGQTIITFGFRPFRGGNFFVPPSAIQERARERVKGHCPLRVQGGACKFSPRKRSNGDSRKSPPQKQTNGLRLYRGSGHTGASPQNNSSVMLRMTAPFAQRSLGKEAALTFPLQRDLGKAALRFISFAQGARTKGPAKCRARNFSLTAAIPWEYGF